MGDPTLQLSTAEKYLAEQLGPINKRSSIYQTAAWGNNDQPDFLNQVIVLQSNVDAGTCMKRILEIEYKMGRVRALKNAPRIIDIDILYFNKETDKYLVEGYGEGDFVNFEKHEFNVEIKGITYHQMKISHDQNTDEFVIEYIVDL